jgi:thiaminase (transcriptional activator TenA)
MMAFTDELWQAAETIYQAILELPFNRELAAGTLAAERFTYYVQQDSLYLREYTKALTWLAGKAEDPDEAHDLLTYARDAIDVERQLHEMMRQTFAIPPAAQAEPACFAYTHFLLHATAIAPYPVGLAAVLPCFWIYREVGLHIAQRTVANNPFQPWIDTYADPGFGSVVDRMLAITNTAAEHSSPTQRTAMTKAYVQSSRCEWAFWNAAWTLERWGV